MTSAVPVRVRIVVPTWRRPAHLKSLLDCLAPQLRVSPDFRLVVVNDGSDSAAYRQVVSAIGDLVDYRVLPKNVGIAAARIAGFADGDEEYLLFTDDDCRPGPLWLDWVRALIDAHPDTDLIAGYTDIVHERRGWLDRYWQDLPNATPGPAIDQGHLMTAVGACALVRRRFLDDLDGPGVTARGQPEDYHYTQHALSRGATYLVAPKLRTGHVARPGLFVFLRTLYRYGIGAAEYALVHRDAHLARLFRRSIAQAARSGWRASRPRSRTVSALAETTLTLGWHVGLRRYRRKTGTTIDQIVGDVPPFNPMVLKVPRLPDDTPTA